MAYLLKVGEPYNPARPTHPRPAYPDALQYNWRSGVHELVIFQSRLTTREITGIRSGPLDLALVLSGQAIFLCFRFPGALDWSDAVYSYHLVPPDQQQVPPVLTPTQGILLPIILVEATDGIVRAIRVVTLPHDFAAALHDAIRAQASALWDAAAYDLHLARVYLAMSSDQLQRQAVARAHFGRDAGRTPSSADTPSLN